MTISRARPRAFAWIAGPLLLLAGCVSAPLSSPPSDVRRRAGRRGLGAGASARAKAMDEAAAQSVAVAASAPEAAVAAPVPVDPLRPEVRLDLDERAARVDLWDRVRRGFAMPDLDNDLVRDRERWYATRPDYVARMTERGGRYLFHIVEELDKRGMPTELALLPFIESAYNPQAMSVARASGMWQFIPSTGRDFELKQNIFRDDRRDVLASTRAALDYLQKLLRHVRRLAAGAGRLQLGRRQRAAGDREEPARRPADRLREPAHAGRDAALRAQAAGGEEHRRPARPTSTCACPSCCNHPYFLSVPIERDMDVAVAVKLAGMPLEEFQTLNPQMNRPVILAAGTPQVLLPYDNANRFVRELPKHRGPLASWTAWTAPKTMKTAEAARSRRHERGEPARGQPHSGADADQGRLDPARAARQCPARRRLQRRSPTRRCSRSRPRRRRCARPRSRPARKDSVASVAKRYRVSPAQVAEWNEVAPGASFAPGQTIVVYTAASARKAVHARPTRAASRCPAARADRGATRTASSGKSASSSKTARAGKATGVQPAPVAKR